MCVCGGGEAVRLGWLVLVTYRLLGCPHPGDRRSGQKLLVRGLVECRWEWGWGAAGITREAAPQDPDLLGLDALVSQCLAGSRQGHYLFLRFSLLTHSWPTNALCMVSLE